MTDWKKVLEEMASSRIQWERELINGIKQNDTVTSQEVNAYYLLRNDPSYYVSTYECPTCRKNGKLFYLYKMKAHGRVTSFNGYQLDLANIFTCPLCRYFYASIDNGGSVFSNQTLGEYALVSKHYSDINEYQRVLQATL